MHWEKSAAPPTSSFSLSSLPPSHYVQTGWFPYLFSCLAPRLLGVPVEVGATSPLYLATAETEHLVPGAMYDAGPHIHLFDLTKAKHYSAANAAAAFDAIDAAIVRKGGPAFAVV